jgi:ATP-dependent exoDNAse (exonuclease V) beta subunit
LIVEAAAGTGKTTELIRRILKVLTDTPGRLDTILAVTFTERAAGELKLRLRSEIEHARIDPKTAKKARQRLLEALPLLEEARIGTIHSFCADLLREHPVEAGVDPQFEVAPEDVADSLFDVAFDRWFEGQLAAPGEGVRRILRRSADKRPVPGRDREPGPRWMLRYAAKELKERRDFPSPWRRDPGFRRDELIDELVEEIVQLGEFAADGDPDDWFTKSLQQIEQFGRELRRRETVSPRDYDGLEQELSRFCRGRHWDWRGFRSSRSAFPKAEVLDRRNALHTRLVDFASASGADIAPLLRDDLWPVIEAYEQLKARAGRLDFLDLLMRARDLVRDNSSVRRDLQGRFTHIFVDEFQDTDPVQAELLLLLASDDSSQSDWRLAKSAAGKLFCVSDPKQSIYRFRRADLSLYHEVKRHLLSSGGDVVHLTVSFRSVPELQEAVNAAFAPRMPGDSPAQADYVAFDEYRPSHAAQPALIALPVPRPFGDYGSVVKWKIEESLPDAVAAFVGWLVDKSGWTVTERENPDERVAIKSRHICLLFRRFRKFSEDVTRPYVRALEARHLPHLLVGGTSFHTREEVEALRNGLAAIEKPSDEFSVFATLHGPFFAFSDADLLTYRSLSGTLHPFRPVPDDLPGALNGVADALAVLRELHRTRNRQPIASTIAGLLAATRAHAGLASWPTGEQALANVMRLTDLARRAERHGVISFRGFVEFLDDQDERGGASDAPILEEGTEGVRIMTVHKAKGLEFPVVILADMTANETVKEPSRWVDADRGLCAIRLAGCQPPELRDHAAEELAREREEAVRLSYVAATRARDLLVVPAVGDARQEGWLAALNQVIYPSSDRSRSPETRQPPGCPEFGEDTMLRDEGSRIPPTSVAPGLHRPEAGKHRVVWWDPNVLDLDVQESVGLRQQKILQADDGSVQSDAGIRAHDRWQEDRTQTRESGGVHTVRVVTATGLAVLQREQSQSAFPVDDVTIEAIDVAFGRPTGRRFGSLVHALLATAEFDTRPEELRHILDAQKRSLGATYEEVEAALLTVVGALEHPLIRRAAAASKRGECRRETSLTLKLDDGTLVEGFADVAFLETEPAPAWTVVDFKTDAEIAGRLEDYRKQVAIYARGVSEATGVPARAVLLRL